jgi:hypothetical protein
MEYNPKRRTGHFTSVGRVGTEVGRIYRLAMKGEMDTIECLRMAQVLNILKGCLETTEIEKKLEELEAAIGRGNPRGEWPKLVS